MPFNLFKSSGATLGVDIGTSSVKIVELSPESGRWKLVNYGLYELHAPDGTADTARTIMDMSDEQITQAIAEIVRTAGMKARNAIASVSSFATFATVIELPYTTEEDLATTVPLEARKYIPVPLDQVILDWSIIGVAGKEGSPLPTTPTAGTSVEVFLAAVPKDETARYQRIMKGAGLNLVALELENSSLVRAILGNDLSPTAIVNIGGRSTSIVIVSRGYERLSHNYEIGGYEMTKAVAAALAIDPSQAEALKHRYGLIDSPENKARDAILPLVDMLVFETRKTIESYERSRNKRISRVVVVGGLANMPGFTGYLKQKIDRDILVGNVFARLVYPTELTPLVQTLSNMFSIAIGAAMRPT